MAQIVTSSPLRAVFVRHGESAANVGQWDGCFAHIPLTNLGHRQSVDLAASWQFAPSRIFVSPYLRAQQTAEPTIARFPQAPVETWDVHEFTYWDNANWNGTPAELQQAEVERFWSECDPEYRHGPNSETFTELLQRAEAALTRLRDLQVEAPVIVFTHGHFIQAVRHNILYPHWNAAQKMRNFRDFDFEQRVANCERIPAEFDGQQWRLIKNDQVANPKAAALNA